MQSELKPCPFCEGKAGLDQFHPTDLNEWRAICDACESWGPERPTADEAITAWNTRTTPAAAADREAIARIMCRQAHELNPQAAAFRDGEIDTKVEVYWSKWLPAADAILALRPADQVEGWVCVPREPTETMIKAWSNACSGFGWKAFQDMSDEDADAVLCRAEWSAMIAATPAPTLFREEWRQALVRHFEAIAAEPESDGDSGQALARRIAMKFAAEEIRNFAPALDRKGAAS